MLQSYPATRQVAGTGTSGVGTIKLRPATSLDQTRTVRVTCCQTQTAELLLYSWWAITQAVPTALLASERMMLGGSNRIMLLIYFTHKTRSAGWKHTLRQSRHGPAKSAGAQTRWTRQRGRSARWTAESEHGLPASERWRWMAGITPPTPCVAPVIHKAGSDRTVET